MMAFPQYSFFQTPSQQLVTQVPMTTSAGSTAQAFHLHHPLGGQPQFLFDHSNQQYEQQNAGQNFSIVGNANNGVIQNVFSSMFASNQENQFICDSQKTYYGADSQNDGRQIENSEEPSEYQNLRQCISQVMSKRQNIVSSTKRKEILQKHRTRFLEETIEYLHQNQLESEYNTTEEFEYMVNQNIERLVREQEEEDVRRLEYEQELQRQEDDYFSNMLLQYQQELEDLNLKACDDQVSSSQIG